MEETLQMAGLSSHQAQAYIYLLLHGESSPPQIAAALGLTRSNAYKVLEKLLEMNLAARTEVEKKFVYRPEDPIALTAIIANERNRLRSLEQRVNESLVELRRSYDETTTSRQLQTYSGNEAVNGIYQQLVEGGKPLFYIASHAKTGKFDSNGRHQLRGSTTAVSREPSHPVIPDYTAPVDWIVSDDDLLILLFGQQPTAIRITNPKIAEAFVELHQLLGNSLQPPILRDDL